MKTVWPSVLAVTAPASADESALYLNVIGDAVLLELQRQGLRVRSTEDEAVRRLLWEEERTEETGEASGRLVDAAEEAGADFLLATTYETSGGRIRAEFRWIDVRERTVSGVLSREYRIDLELDAPIRESVAVLVSENRERILSLRRQVPVAVEDEGGVEPGGRAEPDAGDEPGERGRVTERERPLKRLELSVGFSPFVATGEVSAYFKLGLMPSFACLYRFGLPGGILGVGLFAGFNSFQAEGLLATARSFLLPVGPDVRYWFAGGMPVALFLRLSAGPALFSVDVSGERALKKIVIFALGGIGLGVPFSSGFGLNAEAAYSVFFDKPDPIMGFVPALCLYARF